MLTLGNFASRAPLSSRTVTLLGCRCGKSISTGGFPGLPPALALDDERC